MVRHDHKRTEAITVVIKIAQRGDDDFGMHGGRQKAGTDVGVEVAIHQREGIVIVEVTEFREPGPCFGRQRIGEPERDQIGGTGLLAMGQIALSLPNHAARIVRAKFGHA